MRAEDGKLQTDITKKQNKFYIKQQPNNNRANFCVKVLKIEDFQISSRVFNDVKRTFETTHTLRYKNIIFMSSKT